MYGVKMWSLESILNLILPYGENLLSTLANISYASCILNVE